MLRTWPQLASVQSSAQLSQDDLRYTRVSDVRAQLRFLEEVETLKKKRKDEEEREQLLRLARVNWT